MSPGSKTEDREMRKYGNTEIDTDIIVEMQVAPQRCRDLAFHLYKEYFVETDPFHSFPTAPHSYIL